MDQRFSRTELMFGSAAMQRLENARVAIFGLGGVGGYTAEALSRSGIGTLDLIDHDTVSLSNINRQIYATEKTVGRYKAEVAKERILEINPRAKVNIHKIFYTPETEKIFDFSQYDYIVDAIDTVAGKIALVLNAQKANTPIISAMGAGNKTDPTQFQVSDLYKTSVCPLAKVMRSRLRKLGVKKLKVVYSREEPFQVIQPDETTNAGRPVPGSNAFVPPAVGLILAGEVVKALIKEPKQEEINQ